MAVAGAFMFHKQFLLLLVLDCGIPDIIQSGYLSVFSTLQGSLAEVSCQSGYLATADAIGCQANGSWTAAQCLKGIIEKKQNHMN